jgi:hypothetical protein
MSQEMPQNSGDLGPGQWLGSNKDSKAGGFAYGKISSVY